MNPSADQQPSMPMPSQPAAAAPMAPPIADTPPPAAAPAAASAVNNTPQVAEDNDLIEKEWVVKARDVVSKTRQDPFEQNRQLAALKADYMQKRYNKTVKLSE